jgi:hypothetical protein
VLLKGRNPYSASFKADGGCDKILRAWARKLETNDFLFQSFPPDFALFDLLCIDDTGKAFQKYTHIMDLAVRPTTLSAR